MDVEHVIAPHVLAHLPDRLEKRQALDVADGAADLDDEHLGGLRPGQTRDALFHLIGDVRDHLNRATQVIPTAFLGDDRGVDLARSDV